METATKICKVCGKEYPYCHTLVRNKFRYQDVACSPECGEKYFAMVAEARGEILPDVSSKVSDTKPEFKSASQKRRAKLHEVEAEEQKTEPVKDELVQLEE